MTQSFIDSLTDKELWICSKLNEGDEHFDEHIFLTFKDGIIYNHSWEIYELCSIKDIEYEFNRNKFRYSVETGRFDFKSFCQDLICYLLENKLLDVLEEWLDDDVPLYCILRNDEDKNEKGDIIYKECELDPLSYWV